MCDANAFSVCRRRCVALFAALLILAGCSNITVRHITAPDLLAEWRASILDAETLSARTLQTLRQIDLEQVYRHSPAEAYARLQALADRDPQPERLFALSEMSYYLGRQAEKNRNPNAIAFYYFSAGYAYHYLFPSGSEPPALKAQFDPRFRLACDLYNAGLAKCLRAAQSVRRLDPGGQLHVPTPDGLGVTFSIVHHGFAWKASEFGPLLFAADYAVEGLENQYHDYGLGVPLIGSLANAASGPAHAFYPRHVNFPVTAFFRFQGTVADLTGERAGQLELYNPLAVQTVLVQGRTIPLEADLTTPLAYFLSRTDLNEVSFEGLVRADKVERQTGIYMFEPYEPGKIPVLMVHGLWSSPLTWSPMFNDLRADPQLRSHFQFWFYLYPTANPYPVTAADLRQTLAQLRAELDPHHEDAALDQMVMVGHSMGGLVSKLLTVASGDDFWRLVSTEPLQSLKVTAQTHQELQDIFYFESVPSIRRVVFVATPHHGSILGPSLPARLAERFIRLPKRLVNVAQDVSKENPELWASIRAKQLPTSLDLLAPGAPALELLAARLPPAGVHYHSIVGVLPHLNPVVAYVVPGGESPEGTDGVVPFTSAHLEGADSELIVPADHLHVHHHPLAVQEVRRILLEHLRGAQGEIQLTAARKFATDEHR
jgi:pimeloyl-ACP methyl ester carboxylesterase